MAALRSIVLSVLFFTLLGVVLGTLLAPELLPTQLCGLTADQMTSRPCVLTVQEATRGLLQYQGYSGLAGAILGLVVGIVFVAKRPTPKTNGPVVTPHAPESSSAPRGPSDV